MNLRRWITVLLAATFLSTHGVAAPHVADFQYSVPVQSEEGRRAFLWIPPECRHLRGLIFALNNMLEERFVLDPVIRKAAADCGLGIVWVHPGPDKESPLDGIMRNGNAAAAVQSVLAALAAESGYSEIEFAPLIVVEHSACSPFVYSIQHQMPDRIAAAIPLKGWCPGWRVFGIPNLAIAQEISEHDEDWMDDQRWKHDVEKVSAYRRQDERCLMGQMVDIGAGHYHFSPESAVPIAMFIRKAVTRRLPADVPMSGPVKLRDIDPKSGWLIDPAKLGTPEGVPVAVTNWPGDPKTGFWYFDEEMARAVNHYMADQLRKKPQLIQPMENGKLMALDKKGLAEFHPTFEADGATFRLAAAWYAKSPFSQLYGGAELGHTTNAICFRVSSGGLEQVGKDLFRVGLHRGSILKQGNPWEPWIMAYSEGDREFRRANRPIHVWISLVNKAGEPQTLEFPPIPDQLGGALRPITLTAKATSGLPAQYFVVSGPVTLEGDTLQFDRIPPRTKFPMRVMVTAFQWGRATDPKIQSAGPVTRELFIRR
jgi:hypothetical protein